MGFSEKLIAVGGAVALASKFLFDYQQSQEAKRRKESPLRFDERLTPTEFDEMARDVAARTPRVRSARVRGMEVTLVVRSNSGLTTWESGVDFNDYGHLTGKYWLTTENTESLVPALFASSLQSRVRAQLASREIDQRR